MHELTIYATYNTWYQQLCCKVLSRRCTYGSMQPTKSSAQTLLLHIKSVGFLFAGNHLTLQPPLFDAPGYCCQVHRVRVKQCL